MSLLEVIKLALHCTRRGRAPFCLRWKVTEKAWNDHCADRECELRFARAIREAVSLGQSGFARVGGFGFAGEMREPALRRRAGWTRCANRLCEGGGRRFCKLTSGKQPLNGGQSRFCKRRRKNLLPDGGGRRFCKRCEGADACRSVIACHLRIAARPFSELPFAERDLLGLSHFRKLYQKYLRSSFEGKDNCLFR